jgi:RsiW-degrading membrane proteinase PrsW (M82 family)
VISKLLWTITGFLFLFAAQLSVPYLQQPLAVTLTELIFVLLAFLVIRWADAYEPEDDATKIWAVLWGAGPAFTIAWTIYVILGNIQVGNFAVGIIEELSKATVVIIALRAKLIHSWTDGFVYGALCGLGFSFSEDLLYASTVEGEVEMIIYRGFVSIFAHSIFTGIIGALIVHARQSRKGSLLIASIIPGALIHAGWNSLAENLENSSFSVMALIAPSAFVVIAIFLRDIERKSLVFAANNQFILGRISEDTYLLVTNLRHRKKQRKRVLSKVEKLNFDLYVKTTCRALLDDERLR